MKALKDGKKGTIPQKYLEAFGLIGMSGAQDGDSKLTESEKKRYHQRVQSLDTRNKKVSPGPGDYNLPSSFSTMTNPYSKQLFYSATPRFKDTLFTQSFGAKNKEIGPGTYELKEDIQKKEAHVKSQLRSNLEIVQFHKLRQQFPDKTSISTVQLNKIKPYALENVGPGSYTKASESVVQPKKFGASLSAAFGSNSNRKLDNTSPGIIPNPGPGQYMFGLNTIDDGKNSNPSSMFKSIQKRKENYNGDVSFPPPTNYNLQDYNSISKKTLQGGAPNNILALQKAEEKRVFDQIFPFLVQTRMPEDRKNVEMANVGPGSYSPEEIQSRSTLEKTKQLKKDQTSKTFIDPSTQKVVQL